MRKVDVLIIGGSASGIVAAVTGKGNYPDKDFLVVRKEDKVLVPCGIPYIFGVLGSTDKNIMPDAVLEKEGIGLKIGEVVSLDPKNKTCKTADGEQISFDKAGLCHRLRAGCSWMAQGGGPGQRIHYT